MGVGDTEMNIDSYLTVFSIAFCIMAAALLIVVIVFAIDTIRDWRK
jgi:hypothetical protein